MNNTSSGNLVTDSNQDTTVHPQEITPGISNLGFELTDMDDIQCVPGTVSEKHNDLNNIDEILSSRNHTPSSSMFLRETSNLSDLSSTTSTDKGKH